MVLFCYEICRSQAVKFDGRIGSFEPLGPILNAAAKCLATDDPLVGFDSHFPENFINLISSTARRGHRAQFDHAGITYTVKVTPDTKRKAEVEAAHLLEADAYRLGQQDALEAIQ